uniref:Neurochondrin n=1 Tax=Leersia perrieri TaxID=77586 RepID=A0A0D9VM78_9ORYZ
MDMIFLPISNFPDGSRCLELAIHLMQLLVHKLRVDDMTVEKLQGMTSMVISLARLFAVLHTTVKFESLHMLTTLLSQKESLLHGALRSVPSMIWESQIRVGITAILQNRVVSSEKLQALLLAECMMSILGENWLSEDYKVADHQNVMPVDKFVLLVLESARIEVAVLLNELAYLKYESSKNSQSDDAISQKERNLAILFSLIERTIKMISNASSGEGASCQTISESTIMKAITGLNETVGLVLDFLQDAKDHGQRKGDDLLAAVRIVGSYLAEAPYACKEKIRHLLDFIFSIEGQDESSPFHSICFMLPMLSQITMEADGCRTLLSFGGYKMVIDCLIRMNEHDGMLNDTGSMFLACDTIINFLSNTKNAHIRMESSFIRLLQALVAWTGTADDSSIIMTASCVCTLVLDLTTEEFLLSCSDFDSKTLERLSQLIARCYRRWSDRYPRVRNIVQQHVSL